MFLSSDRRERSNPQGAQRGQIGAFEGAWGLLPLEASGRKKRAFAMTAMKL
jgi:hypothetical protein